MGVFSLHSLEPYCRERGRGDAGCFCGREVGALIGLGGVGFAGGVGHGGGTAKQCGGG